MIRAAGPDFRLLFIDFACRRVKSGSWKCSGRRLLYIVLCLRRIRQQARRCHASVTHACTYKFSAACCQSKHTATHSSTRSVQFSNERLALYLQSSFPESFPEFHLPCQASKMQGQAGCVQARGSCVIRASYVRYVADTHTCVSEAK